ncbi:MAG: alcohol dehydrogenase catalytic domain-containing protein [Candidatus Methanofastidiosia archaeon]
MKAAVYHGANDITIEDVPDPVPGSGEVLLKPVYCGICGTDIDAWKRGMYAPGVVIGHEFSAQVVECGAGVEQVKKGDYVVGKSVIPCHSCEFCKNGRYSLCDTMEMPGITINGGCAEFCVLPADSVVTIPENVSLDEAALTEPVSVVMHGFNKIQYTSKDTVILGAGTIGLCALQIALQESSLVGVSEPNEIRRDKAHQMGAHTVIDPAESNVSLSFEEVAGHPPEYVVECSGSSHAASDALSLVRKGGTILYLGISEDLVEADFMTAVLNELTIQFSYCSYSEFSTALSLMAAKKIDVTPIITKKISLENVVEKGFKELTTPDTDHIKILVKL